MKISEARLATIGAQSVRWPDYNTLQWNALRDCITAVRDIVRETDRKIADVESNGDLSDQGRARRISEIAQSAVDQLATLPEYRKAEKGVEEFLEGLDNKRGQMPQGPSNAADIQLYAEIRAHIAKQGKDALAFAMNHRSEPAVLAAVINAPAFLSGMTAEQHNQFTQAAASALWPDDEKARKENADALKVAEDTVKQGLKIVADRGQLVKTPDGYEAKAFAKAA